MGTGQNSRILADRRRYKEYLEQIARGEYGKLCLTCKYMVKGNTKCQKKKYQNRHSYCKTYMENN